MCQETIIVEKAAAGDEGLGTGHLGYGAVADPEEALPLRAAAVDRFALRARGFSTGGRAAGTQQEQE
jgi:hypothetical protein